MFSFLPKDQLKRETIELENTLEKEQESLVNRLWKRMEKLETDKRLLQMKLEQPELNSNVFVRFVLRPSTEILDIFLQECPPSSSSDSSMINRNPSNPLLNSSSNLSTRLSLPNLDHIQQLKKEVEKLKKELLQTQELHRQKMDEFVKEEQDIRNENLRLQRKLQLEVCRWFSLRRFSSLLIRLGRSS